MTHFFGKAWAHLLHQLLLCSFVFNGKKKVLVTAAQQT